MHFRPARLALAMAIGMKGRIHDLRAKAKTHGLRAAGLACR
jgi:hypothetical protein